MKKPLARCVHAPVEGYAGLFACVCVCEVYVCGHWKNLLNVPVQDRLKTDVGRHLFQDLDVFAPAIDVTCVTTVF